MSVEVRRSELIHLLRSRRKDTIPNLARDLGVSRSTINRDISALTERHMIRTEQGNGGGIIYEGNPYPHKGILGKRQIWALEQSVENAAEKKQDECREVLEEMLESLG